MSSLSTALSTALAALSSFKGESLTYSATVNGSYAALTGWVLHIDRLPGPAFNDERQAGEVAQAATLKGPLTPVLLRGYFVVDGNGQKWSVEGVKTEGQQICTMMRTKNTIRGPDRGNFS